MSKCVSQNGMSGVVVLVFVLLFNFSFIITFSATKTVQRKTSHLNRVNSHATQKTKEGAIKTKLYLVYFSS